MCSHTQNNCPFSPQRDHSFFFKKNCFSLFVCFAWGLKMPTAESSGGTVFRERIILQCPFLLAYYLFLLPSLHPTYGWRSDFLKFCIADCFFSRLHILCAYSRVWLAIWLVTYFAFACVYILYFVVIYTYIYPISWHLLSHNVLQLMMF